MTAMNGDDSAAHKKDAVEHELGKSPVPIVALVETLIEYAHVVRASDIHIDPTPADTRVRLRVDGVLNETFSFPKLIHHEVIARIKVLASLRSDEHFAMQDGRFRFLSKESNEQVDIRVAIAPLYHGENVVLRLLTNHTDDTTLAGLGFSDKNIDAIRRAVQKPNGMILATGPTGSGKTTTLYTLLKLLNDPSISVITIEDPIEYAIAGIKQIQTHERTQLTFAKGLRSILRQDPDIIMVGEIRDTETARIAVSAALTGHLLFSTLHTKDAATTLPRLLDMGIDAYLVASTISLAIAQRLVRKCCVTCKGKGCVACGNTGYRGRIAISEVLVADEAIRDAILHRASATEIKKIAIQNGMRTMLDDGEEKVKRGETTIEEVLRVIHE
jgi:type IV pilus assembly protein PilB